ncbi:MAG: hypothetical protein WC770_09545, partial [Phycisphaerae bacterium]
VVIITFLVCAAFAGLICGPYLLDIKNLMSETTDRTGKDFNYSASHIFNLMDTVGSLVYPPAAQTEGVYFFSIAALLIIFLYLFAKSTDKFNLKRQIVAKKPDSYLTSEIAIKVFFILWIGFISYITYGKNSYLFVFLWKHLPGFSSLRTWGRLNIILLPILAWLLSLAFNHFEDRISDDIPIQNKSFWKRNQRILTLVSAYVAILCVQLYLILNKVYDHYWIKYFQNVSGYNEWFLYSGIISFAIILLVLIISKKHVLATSKIKTFIVFFLIAAATIEMWPVGTHMWTHNEEPLDNRNKPNVVEFNPASFNFSRIDGNYSISLMPVFSVGTLENWYFDRYVKFLKQNSGNLQARKILLGVLGKQRVFFSMSIDYKTIEEFLNDSLRYKNHGHILSYTGDELQWEIQTPVSGYVSFIDNWDNGWKAFVDSREVKIELLFGTFKSVAVKEGLHQIKFVYKPGLFIL